MTLPARDLPDLLLEAFGTAASAGSAIVASGSAADVRVAGVHCDSRLVGRGDIFVVVPGTHEHGAHYAEEAVSRGAAALVAESEAAAALGSPGVPIITVPDAREALGLIAAALHGRPSEQLDVIGVTGTNGKTTTIHLIAAALEAARGTFVARLGTIEYAWGEHREPASHTTPGAERLQPLLAGALSGGCGAAAVEVSSHALDQRRLAGTRVRAAVFTNLSGDHLDYHGSMDAYARSKARLFELVEPDGVAAVNAEDPRSPNMEARCRGRVVRYALDPAPGVDVYARALHMEAGGVRFELVTPAGTAPVASPLLGRFNVMNLLAAAAIAVGMGAPVDDVARGLGSVSGVRGRLEPVNEGQPFGVLVDYAHTDDAVRNVLRNLRGVVTGRLIAVLGCGGDRDRTKRPRMGRAAAELADVCWFTSDNPRSEEPRAILEDMLVGNGGARNVHLDADRASAIAAAIALARPGDCVAVLGKGHESYQEAKGVRVPFDDREVAALALRALCGGRVDGRVDDIRAR